LPSTIKTMTTLRVRSVTRRGSLDSRLWLRRRTMMWLRSATAAMTWHSPPSLRWRHVSGRSLTLTLQAQHLEVRRPLRPQHSAVDVLRSRQGAQRQLRPHGGLLPTGDGRHHRSGSTTSQQAASRHEPTCLRPSRRTSRRRTIASAMPSTLEG
jgi:hypothetical protein